MTDNVSPEAAFNLGLMNPEALEEPKETFPVKVLRSRLRWSSPEYNAANSFRQAFPHRGPGYGPEGNSIQQWALVLERQDAVYYHEDGSPFEVRDADNKPTGQTAQTVPVIVYAGIDLEKMDKNGVIKGIMKTRGKEPYVLGAWTKSAGSLTPDASVIEGRFFTVERFREKEIAPGFFAKNIVVPVAVLPPTFTYTGEVQRFKANREANDASVGEAVAAGASASVSKEAAAAAIASFLAEKGIDPGSADVTVLGLPDFPKEARIEPFMTAAATGNLAATLAGFGV
jgi:hypothetical protein